MTIITPEDKKVIFTSWQAALEAWFRRLYTVLSTNPERDELLKIWFHKDDKRVCESYWFSWGIVLVDECIKLGSKYYHKSHEWDYFYKVVDTWEYVTNRAWYAIVVGSSTTVSYSSADKIDIPVVNILEDSRNLFRKKSDFSWTIIEDEEHCGDYNLDYREFENPLISLGTYKEIRVLRDYHSGAWDDTWITNEDDKFRFGMEFEKSEIVCDSSPRAHRGFTEAGWRCERDATVAAEYITPVLSLSKVEDSIDWIMNTWQEILDGKINDNCGWHIHISSSIMITQELFDYFKYLMPLFWSLYPERAKNSYSKKPDSNHLSATSYRRDIELSSQTIEPWIKWEKTLRFRLNLLSVLTSQIEFWYKTHTDVDFWVVLKWIKSSPELMEALTIVYNTPEKITALVSRIIPFYNEAIKWGWMDFELVDNGKYAELLDKFCKEKKVPKTVTTP